jgi:hypothetical protein
MDVCITFTVPSTEPIKWMLYTVNNVVLCVLQSSDF